jgi:hypothetical protein
MTAPRHPDRVAGRSAIRLSWAIIRMRTGLRRLTVGRAAPVVCVEALTAGNVPRLCQNGQKTGVIGGHRSDAVWAICGPRCRNNQRSLTVNHGSSDAFDQHM